MPSFDVLSEVDWQEVRNATTNAQREIANRWDFRQVATTIELNDQQKILKLATESEFQLQQLLAILCEQLTKREIERSACNIPQQTTHSGKLFSLEITFKQGLETPLAKKMVKLIKAHHPKTEAQIQEKQLRVTDKSRNTLQAIMTLLRQAALEQPLQFTNFRE